YASLLTGRAPVELAGLHLLEQDLRAAHATRETGAVIHPVPVVATRHGATPRARRQAVHRHHLAGLHADLEERHPIAPERPRDLFRHSLPRHVRVEPGTEEHLGAVDVADPADDGLVHQQLTDGDGAPTNGGDEALLVLGGVA